MHTDRDIQEIACQQVLLKDSSVFSVQWSILPLRITVGLTTRRLLERYLTHIRRATLSAIRPAQSPGGIEFRLLGSRLSLISFLPPEEADGVLILHICGGLLVQSRNCHRGELSFSLQPTPAGIKACLQLSDYYPLILGSSTPSPLRRRLYRLTQAAIHRLVTVRFLMRIHRELTGNVTPVRVLNVNLCQGEPL